MTTQARKISSQKEVKNYKAESYTGIYGMHKYWSKKPYNIIRDFIKKYSKADEIVVDPFCGSGVSIIESVLCGRKAIGFDVNPSAIFITEQMLNKVPTEKLISSFEKIEIKIKDEINNYYTVLREGKKYKGTHYIWENNLLMEVWYENENGKKVIDKPLKSDLTLINSFDYRLITNFYPKENFFQNSRINAHGKNKLFNLFTPRNLKALALIMNEIELIEDINIKNTLKFCFTSSVGQASKMVFVIKKRKNTANSEKVEKKEVGSWVIGYWMPKECFEINVWKCFENRYNKILKAKKEQETLNYNVFKSSNFKKLITHEKNLLLLNESAQSALKIIPDNSVDYIITDPPHGNRIPYLELSMLWNSWLKLFPNYDDEIIVSEAKERNKNAENYHFLLDQVFDQIQRILKVNKHFSLMFNSLDDNTWINIISKLHSLDFELIKVETLEYSANSVVQDTRKQGLKTDFIITFRKNPLKSRNNLEIISILEHEKKILDIVNNLFLKRIGDGLETYEILNLVFKYYLTRDTFFKISDVIKILNLNYEYKNNKWQKLQLTN